MALILAHIFGVIELPPSHSAHVWVISPTHIYNNQIVGLKWVMLLNLEMGNSLSSTCGNTLIDTLSSREEHTLTFLY
jgi:hypothetical protein